MPEVSEIKKQVEEDAKDIAKRFEASVQYLLRSGAIDMESDRIPLNTIYAVALKNVASGYLRGRKDTREYRALIRV